VHATEVGFILRVKHPLSYHTCEGSRLFQTPPDLVVKFQRVEIVEVVLWRVLRPRIVPQREIQIPPDLVVKWQAIDIAYVIFSPIWRRHIVHTGGRNRKSRDEPLSPSAAHRSTT